MWHLFNFLNLVSHFGSGYLELDEKRHCKHWQDLRTEHIIKAVMLIDNHVWQTHKGKQQHNYVCFVLFSALFARQTNFPDNP